MIQSLVWLSSAKDSIAAKAYIGEDGQIYVLPPGSSAERRFLHLEKQLPLVINADSAKAVLALGRHVADTVTLNFSKEKNRVSVVLPEELRLLECAPRAGEIAVVCVLSDALEIWRAINWREHLRTVRTRLEGLVEESTEDLHLEE